MDKTQLEKLQKSSNIKLNSKEEELFIQDFDIMTDLLNSMSQFSDKVEPKNFSDVSLRTISKIEDFQNTKSILANSKHNIVNNSIQIKSVI